MDYRLSDLLDLPSLQKMADAHYRAAGMPIGIIDAIDGSILIGSGWQEICVRFHRAHPESLQRCRESDNHIKACLVEGEACQYKCKNGLWDIGIPVVVAGHHLATLFLGQFFYEGEMPDRTFFIRQAHDFSFDEADYLAALDKVPVLSREQVGTILEYDKALVGFIADLAQHSLQKIRADEITRESERKLKQQADFLQLLMDTMPYPIFYKDCQGRYLGCNRAFEKFYGMKREEISGKTVYEIAPKELADVYFQADNELFTHPGTQAYESTVQTIDGDIRYVLFHKATYNGPDGTPGGLIGALVDITDRKRTEEERQQLQDQLVQARKMESIGRLAGGVAHDFNNMLSVILGNVDLAMKKAGVDHPLLGHLAQIEKAAEHSADLTRQLLAFARKQTVTPQLIDLNEMVGRMLSMLRRLVGENIDLVWTPGADLWLIWIDPAQVDQILMNLTVNARDSIAEVGSISIETCNVAADALYCAGQVGFEPGEYVMLTLGDTGAGMDRETLDNIFDPFFSTKEAGKGTGLGLATVYGIVKQNEGFIHVDSEPGRGTSFRIYLPRHRGETQGVMGETPVETMSGGPETVLVVEDESMLLELAQSMLEQLGYQVLTAAVPGEAVRLVREYAGPIHLLMTDVIMPEMNGRDLARKLLSFQPSMKRLFMSGYTANVIAHHGVLEEGVHFVQKPFSLEELAAKVREALNQSQ
jgi:PAS domain S-box-containing protein